MKHQMRGADPRKVSRKPGPRLQDSVASWVTSRFGAIVALTPRSQRYIWRVPPPPRKPFLLSHALISLLLLPRPVRFVRWFVSLLWIRPGCCSLASGCEICSFFALLKATSSVVEGPSTILDQAFPWHAPDNNPVLISARRPAYRVYEPSVSTIYLIFLDILDLPIYNSGI